MANKTTQLLGSYYCRLALLLCQQAREHLNAGNLEEASRLCKFISTLCAKNNYPLCREESQLCSAVASYCQQGNLEEARRICDKARRICPKSFNVYGG